MPHHIELRNAKYVVVFMTFMLADRLVEGFNREDMLTPEQEAYVAVTAHRLADTREVGNELHVVARQQLLEASGDSVIQMEWGSVLPSPEVSQQLLDKLIHLSPAIGRLSLRMTVDDTQGCWAMPLNAEYDDKKRARYPTIYDPATKKQGVLAHRYVWRNLIDPDITRHDHLDHLCRVHACCNLSHLELVTVGQNTQRGNLARHILSGQDVLFHPE